jgi:hypothetical protein
MRQWGGTYFPVFPLHRFSAALRAISLRRSGDRLAARRFASATAALFFARFFSIPERVALHTLLTQAQNA